MAELKIKCEQPESIQRFITDAISKMMNCIIATTLMNGIVNC
ncbi:hypothetical protein PN499_16835 [Kamptonema animale CS-326]|jgi:hypothetical protein|nr:hypothetical protein [Kamptonema animale]MDB9512857.1 hypothetical protein [Kamptonema animale CS-326]